METIRLSRMTAELLNVLRRRGLEAPFRRAFAARGWLFVELDVAQMRDLAPYLRDETLHHLRAVLERPVYPLNSRGFRYAVRIGPALRLPREIRFPGFRPDRFRLGQGLEREVTLEADRPGHGLVAGQSRYGKTAFLRLLAVQALGMGFRVDILDPRGLLLAGLEVEGLRRWPLEEAPALLEDLEQEMREQDRQLAEARAEDLTALNEIRTARGEPPLPRRLVLIDEAEALFAAGGRRDVRERLARLLWQTAKDGIHFVLAGHEPTREMMGPLRDAFLWRVAFRLLTPSASRAFLGRAGAERIRIPGRAISPELGVFQAYFLPPEEAERALQDPGRLFAPEEQAVLRRAVAEDGRITLERLMSAGLPERAARALLARLRRRGLALKDPSARNAHRLTPFALQVLSCCVNNPIKDPGLGEGEGARPIPAGAMASGG